MYTYLEINSVTQLPVSIVSRWRRVRYNIKVAPILSSNRSWPRWARRKSSPDSRDLDSKHYPTLQCEMLIIGLALCQQYVFVSPIGNHKKIFNHIRETAQWRIFWVGSNWWLFVFCAVYDAGLFDTTPTVLSVGLAYTPTFTLQVDDWLTLGFQNSQIARQSWFIYNSISGCQPNLVWHVGEIKLQIP